MLHLVLWLLRVANVASAQMQIVAGVSSAGLCNIMIPTGFGRESSARKVQKVCLPQPKIKAPGALRCLWVAGN